MATISLSQPREKRSNNSKMIHMKRFVGIMLAFACWFVLISATTSQLSHSMKGSNSRMGKSQMVTSLVARDQAVMEPAPPMMEAMMEESSDFASVKSAAEYRGHPAKDGMASIKFSSSTGQLVANQWDKAVKELDKKEYTRERMLIHDGHITMEVLKGDLSRVMANVHKLLGATENQGYIEEESWYQLSHDRYTTNATPLKGVNLRMRIASDRFDTTMKDIRQVAGDEKNIIDWRSSTRDVTDSYVDATTRANVVEASRQSLQVLLQNAQSVKDVFAIEQELTRLTEQYESHKQRASALAKDAALSTIFLNLREREDISRPPDRLSSLFSPIKAAKEAMDDLTEFLGSTGNQLVYLLVVSVPIILIACAVFYLCFSWCVPIVQRSQFCQEMTAEGGNPYRKIAGPLDVKMGSD